MRLIALLMLTLAACAPKSAVSRIEILEAQVAELEQEMARISKTRAPAATARGVAANPAMTQALSEDMRTVNQRIGDGDLMGAKALCAEIPNTHAAALATTEGQNVWRRGRRTCDEMAVVGMRAPNMDVERWFQGADPGPGTPQLLVFWEQWCPHCRREVPRLQAKSERYAGRLNIVALTKINRSSTPEKVEAFISEHGLSFPVAKERNSSLSTAYAVTGVPAAAIVKDGVVIWRGHPARLDDPTLERLLSQ